MSGPIASRIRPVVAIAVVAALVAVPAHAGKPLLALEGGTLVDLSSFGSSTRDLADAVVLIEGGRIVAAGARGEVAIPEGARRIDVTGKYLIPGLVDGFAGMNSAAQARAYLHAGVTSIVAVESPRRGALARDVAPRPRLFELASVGYGDEDEPEAAPEAVVRRIDSLKAAGARVLLLMYPLPPESVAAAIGRARALGLATIGELGETPYPAALALGVDALVHTSRYSLPLAPEEVRRAVAKQPFGPPKLAYYQLLVGELASGPRVEPWARRLAASSTAIMPTLAMEWLDLPRHSNPWREPEAAILDPAGIHEPADRETGERPRALESGADAFPAGLAETLLALERRYAAAGARYLAGSGTSAFGTLPGISLRNELLLLERIGLTARQALAAATSNYREVYGWSEVGCLEPGCLADVLVLPRDPTADLNALRAIELLIVDGEPLDRGALLAR